MIKYEKIIYKLFVLQLYIIYNIFNFNKDAYEKVEII